MILEQSGPSEGSALLTADEVQRILGLDRSTVYRMAADGRLPAVKVGRQWRFLPDRIAALTQPGAGAPAPDSGQAPGSGTAPVSTTVARSAIEVAAADLGVMMVVTDLAGHPMTPVVNPCPWFADRADDPAMIEVCSADWRSLAADLDLQPRFHLGPFGFECARAFVRSGDRLVAMVLAGGLAPEGAQSGSGLYALDPAARRRVLESLSRVAAVISRASQASQNPAARAAPAASDDRRDAR